jgi:hypothetical protein
VAATSVAQPALKLGKYLVTVFLYAPLTKTSNMGDIVIIAIAEENSERTFNIDRTLLDQKAPGFMKTTSPLGSDDCPVFRLTNVEIETFELFIKWLDTDPENNCHTHTGALLHLAFEERAWERMLPAIKAYIFGERYSIPALCNDALFHLSAFVQAHLYATKSLTNLDRWVYDKEPAHREITYVHANTCTGSILRRFFADAYCAMVVTKIWASYPYEKYPSEFQKDQLYLPRICPATMYSYNALEAAEQVKDGNVMTWRLLRRWRRADGVHFTADHLAQLCRLDRTRAPDLDHHPRCTANRRWDLRRTRRRNMDRCQRPPILTARNHLDI